MEDSGILYPPARGRKFWRRYGARINTDQATRRFAWFPSAIQQPVRASDRDLPREVSAIPADVPGWTLETTRATWV